MTFECINIILIAKLKYESRQEYFIRVQTQYLYSLNCTFGGKGKNPEDILEEMDNPKPIKTAEQIEKEIEEKFKPYMKG